MFSKHLRKHLRGAGRRVVFALVLPRGEKIGALSGRTFTILLPAPDFHEYLFLSHAFSAFSRLFCICTSAPAHSSISLRRPVAASAVPDVGSSMKNLLAHRCTGQNWSLSSPGTASFGQLLRRASHGMPPRRKPRNRPSNFTYMIISKGCLFKSLQKSVRKIFPCWRALDPLPVAVIGSGERKKAPETEILSGRPQIRIFC